MPAETQNAVFFAHGSPMAAIEETDPYAAAVREFGKSLPRPRAIVVISAHWQEPRPIRITAWDRLPVIHDFSGFPEELHRLSYPAPGDPGMAAEIASMLNAAGEPAVLDRQRGLDHGAWVPLRYAWPEADIPVLELSLPAPLARAQRSPRRKRRHRAQPAPRRVS
jgi:4,5-DOPA dioxygenase extradiol